MAVGDGLRRLAWSLPVSSQLGPAARLRHGHQLAEELSEHQAQAALTLVEETQQDPMLRALGEAPQDDEPPTPDEDASAREAHAAYLRGEAISADELKPDIERE